MIRLFQEHYARRTESLDGLWTIALPDGRTFPMIVPGVWETVPELASYEGKAVYARSVMIDRDSCIMLRFGGVSHTAAVFWDGKPVGSHYNAFTGFDVIIDQVSASRHELRIEVDNSFSENSTLHIPNDYFTYGGINRSAELHYLKGAMISSQTFYAAENEDGTFDAHIRADIRALNDTGSLRYCVELAGAGKTAELGSMKKGDTKQIDITLEKLKVLAWDVHSGQLYPLTGTLRKDGEIIDDLADRVGFRTVEINGESILLNHKRVKILGFNRHEDHGQLGMSMDAGAMVCDLQLMLDMGANAVRTCHYPNDPKFLDLCDELGILVWEEHHARALPGEILRKELFAKQISDCNEEMIRQHVNHPCIYIWGVLNECESETEFGHALYKKNLDQLRALDPTRPVSFASCRIFNDVCLDLVDVVSFNIYPAWYINEPVADFLARLLSWMEENGAKGKPVLITEIGAGAIAGYHDAFRRAKWSEERQADILDEQLQAVLGNERVSGVYIWQFADVKVSEEWAMRRPRTMNNKGVVDEYRRPKLAYFTVKSRFAQEKYHQTRIISHPYLT
ncbi:MAG: hypothetical protein IK140_00970 [Clostridia bacterium]|nr:hypothetical protein [Clostridia bacterium]